MFCRKCGEKLKDDAKFCVKCGTPVPQNLATSNTEGAIPKTNPNPQPVQKPVSPAGHPNVRNTTSWKGQEQMNNPVIIDSFQGHPSKKKSNIGLIAVVILLAIFILGVAGVTLYFTVFNDMSIGEIFNKDEEDGTEDIVTKIEGEGAGTETNTEAEVYTEEAPAETVTEVEAEAEANVTAGEERAIEDQSYKVDLIPHGSVKFVPYTPVNEESDVVFKIMKKDRVITVLPPFYEDNSLAASGAVFVDVEEVFFKDYNIDGVDDIFVNCVYKHSADSSGTFMECRVFRGSAEGDYYMQTSLSNVGTEYAQKDGTIGYYVDELRDLYANYDLPFSNSISYSREELEMLTEEQLMKARNEIYARHGYWFDNENLWKHFSNRDWYEPFTQTVPDSALNEHEIHNRDLILELEENVQVVD